VLFGGDIDDLAAFEPRKLHVELRRRGEDPGIGLIELGTGLGLFLDLERFVGALALRVQFGLHHRTLAGGFAAHAREEIIAGIGEAAGFRLDRVDHDLHDRVEILFLDTEGAGEFGDGIRHVARCALRRHRRVEQPGGLDKRIAVSLGHVSYFLLPQEAQCLRPMDGGDKVIFAAVRGRSDHVAFRVGLDRIDVRHLAAVILPPARLALHEYSLSILFLLARNLRSEISGRK
jgi:hypothetical protein